MASNKLGRTQRDIIRDQNEIDILDSTEVNTVNNTDVTDKTRNSSEEESKNRLCLPKCLLLGTALLVILAGLVTLIYFFKDNGSDNASRGLVYTTPKPRQECPDVHVIIGRELVIKCNMFNPVPGDVKAIYQKLVGAKTEDFECVPDPTDRKNLTCAANHTARCSSYGNVLVRFYDSYKDNRKVIFTKTVQIQAIDGFPVPACTVNQVVENNTSKFQLKLSYTGDCQSYEVGFYGKNKRLTDSVSCKTNYNDNEGYTVDCNATVSSQVIYNYGNGSALHCRLMNGKTVKKEKELEMPDCDDISSTQNCSANTPSLFDCKKFNANMSCDEKCTIIDKCFPLRKVNTSDVSCPDDSCKLKWCRYKDSLEIDRSEDIPLRHLCKRSKPVL